MPSDSSLTRRVAEFIVKTQRRSIPANVMHLGKRSILDGLGLALAGNAAESGRLVRTYLKSLGLNETGCTVIGTNLKVPARFAAFANGIAIHADDYDDTQLAVAKDRVYGLLTHPTAPALPPVLALGERDNRSGADVLTAYQIAVEVETKIAEAINPRHYDHGFHSTATIGTIAAAAGAARLMGLDVEQVRRALGHRGEPGGRLARELRHDDQAFSSRDAPRNRASSRRISRRSAGPRRRSCSKPAAAFSRRPAAATIPRRSKASSAIRGRSRSRASRSSRTRAARSPTPAWGSCSISYASTISVPRQVSKVRVGTNRHMPNALIHHRPKNELQAKFSMEFCMAILLLERKAGLAQFTDEVVNRRDVQRMIEKIEFGVHPLAEAAGYEKMTTIIDIDLAGGRTISGRADFGKGSPVNPMSDEELAAKFRECAAWGRLPKRTQTGSSTSCSGSKS